MSCAKLFMTILRSMCVRTINSNPYVRITNNYDVSYSGEVVGIREPMRTKIITEDKRRIELVYKKTKNKSETLVFEHDAYEVFKKLIPLKEMQE